MDLKQVMAGGTAGDRNLISPSKVVSIAKPPGFYKSIVLDVFSVLIAALFGYSYYGYLSHTFPLWGLLVALTLFGVISVLQVFLAPKLVRRIGVMVLETIAVVASFYSDNLSVLVTTAAVVFVFLLWGYLGSRTDLANSIEIQFFRITGNVLSKFTTGMLLFMILIYVPQLNQNSLFVSRQSFRQFFDWSAGVINNFYPNVSLNGSFQTFAQDVATMELKNNPTFQSLTPQEQSSTISQEATQFANTFEGASTSTGQLSPGAPASDAFYNFIVGMLSAWQSQGPTWFIVGWAVVLFLSLRTVGILFVWFAQFISLIFYEIFLAAGFMRITEATQTRENIGY